MGWNSFHANSFEVITHQFTIVNTIVYFLQLSLIFSRWWISLPNCKVKKSVYRYNIGIMLQVYRYRRFFYFLGGRWPIMAISNRNHTHVELMIAWNSWEKFINFFNMCVWFPLETIRHNYRIKSICNIEWNIYLFILIHCGIIQNILWGPISFTYEWMFLTCRQLY